MHALKQLGVGTELLQDLAAAQPPEIIDASTHPLPPFAVLVPPPPQPVRLHQELPQLWESQRAQR